MDPVIPQVAMDRVDLMGEVAVTRVDPPVEGKRMEEVMDLVTHQVVMDKVKVKLDPMTVAAHCIRQMVAMRKVDQMEVEMIWIH